MIILRYVQLPQLPITPTPCIPDIYFGSLEHFVFNLSFDRLQIKVSFGVRRAFRLGGWITGDRNRSSTQHTFQNTKVHPQVVTFMYEHKNHVSRVAVISKRSARLKSVHSELLSSQFSWSPRFSFARSVWVGVCLDGWSNLPLKWFWNWIENLGGLGMPTSSKTDEFSEKFQTAFDPPTRAFSESYVAIFSEIHD